jgi:hypothetical protein
MSDRFLLLVQRTVTAMPFAIMRASPEIASATLREHLRIAGADVACTRTRTALTRSRLGASLE